MKKAALSALLLALSLLGFACSAASAPAADNSALAQTPTASTQPYEKLLYDLGAFPVSRLTQPYWTNGNPGKVYSKGNRVDVDGWLPPNQAAFYLTDAEKAQYAIPAKPLRYEQYIAMLDIDKCKQTHDPQLFLVMRFALESLGDHQVPVKKADILRVYEAQIGLEEYAAPFLAGQISSADAIRLIGAYADEKLFQVLPKPEPNDKVYIAFLSEQAQAGKWSIWSRQECYELLLALDDKTYRAPYRTFLLGNVKTAHDWRARAILYDALVRMKDQDSLNAVCDGLVHDPITECRESILSEAKEQGEVTSIIDAILVIANGQDAPHHPVTPSRMLGQWRYNLNRYLQWAATQKQLDAATLKKVDDALAKLPDR